MSGDVSAAGGGLGRSAETVRTPSFSASAGQSSVESASKRREPDEFAQKVDVIVVDEGKIIAETALVVQSRRRAAARSEI